VQVGDPEALSFFLPGITSGLCIAVRRSTVDAPGVRGPDESCCGCFAVACNDDALVGYLSSALFAHALCCIGVRAPDPRGASSLTSADSL
jgi:hypothetical protein